MYQLRKKNLADIVAIYGRGRELLRPPTYDIAYVTGLSDLCPEMDQWLSFRPWTCFVLIYSFWAVN